MTTPPAHLRAKKREKKGEISARRDKTFLGYIKDPTHTSMLVLRPNEVRIT